MSGLTPERRGSFVALAVAVAIAILLLVLQPGPKRERQDTEEASGPPATSTTTIPPGVQLCNLAKQFVRDASTLDTNGTARAAATFYEDAAKLVDGSARAEFDATARYYAEYNEIGEAYDYDVFRIAAAGKGDRWSQLLFRPPLGIETARAAVKFACNVELPAPPTSTTLVAEKDPLEDLLPKASGATGASGATATTGTAGANTATTAPSSPATTAR